MQETCFKDQWGIAWPRARRPLLDLHRRYRGRVRALRGRVYAGDAGAGPGASISTSRFAAPPEGVPTDAVYDTIGFYEAAGSRRATIVVPPTSTTHEANR